MKRVTLAIIVFTFVALAAALPAAAQPGAPPCGIAGTWIGQVGDTPLMATYANVVGVVAGTSNLDLCGDPTLGSPYFSAVTRNTSGRGVWTRVHPRTYDYMFVAVGVAADNNVLYQLVHLRSDAHPFDVGPPQRARRRRARAAVHRDDSQAGVAARRAGVLLR